jgi:FtsZ-binding cell division protein ZapB
MSITYKNKSNNIYMNNICENCIELKKDIEILNTKIICLEYDIEELKHENQEFKKENQELKKENKELKKEIQKLKKENQELKLELKYLKFDKIKYKIITAIQDAENKL